MPSPESWLSVARTLGYQDEEDMLRDLYVRQCFSLKDISRIVGYSGWSVRRRLILMHVPMRQRGGDNKSGKRKLAAVPDSEIFREDVASIALQFGVSLATVFSERRFRRCSSAQSVPLESLT